MEDLRLPTSWTPVQVMTLFLTIAAAPKCRVCWQQAEAALETVMFHRATDFGESSPPNRLVWKTQLLHCAFFCFRYYTHYKQALGVAASDRTYRFVKLLDVLGFHLRSGHEVHLRLPFVIACIVVPTVGIWDVDILIHRTRRFAGTLE